MQSSKFSFVHDDILRSNIDSCFEHIIDLLSLSESEFYRKKASLLSSMRKTVIIHTASIIEALLLWKLKTVVRSKKVELSDEWKYSDVKIIYTLSNSEQIIAGRRKKVQKDVNQLDFLRITDVCFTQGIIPNTQLRKQIDAVRKLRNMLHIGNLSEKEKEYSKSDIEYCLNVVVKVRKLVSR